MKELERQKQNILKEVEDFVKDKKNSLDDRWNKFVEAGEAGILIHKKYLEHFEGKVEDWLDSDVLDGDRFQRHENLTAPECIDIAEDHEKSKEFIEDLKEQWMDKFIFSFEFDW